ncbi:LacI family DNA-binding transcriptional regulator [Vallitalea sp.]|jgi:LacI family transcriptional regulator|uniref:LacI family DNA-binding transcriptional regulator n=1 Tax=Vallitalea sp. TaxID=1882829 RepID=UPI0025CDE307|nr:LacI family DNA-binding transcriptional regulator [Vallitalea sp.]MCT4687896.1 LacI family transcriptional regulator [Vallitalea sp.]
MAVTIKNIADACNVSRGTVDRALNNRGKIKPEKKELILATAKKLGYKPNYIARSLKKGKTNTIGIIVFNLYNEFFSSLINYMEVKAKEKDYHIDLALTHYDKDIEKKCVENMIKRQVDGLILCSVNNEKDYSLWLQNFNIPLITLANKVSDRIPYISVDNKLAMKDAAQFVHNKGYNRIIYISPPLAYKSTHNIYALKQRFEGFSQINMEHKSIIIDSKDYIRELETINILEHKTVILCSSDIYALEVLNYLKEKKIKIPSQVGVMGFDNINMLKYIEPHLTTVSYPIEQIGAIAIDSISKAIESDDKIQNVVIKHKIIQGESL